MEVIDIDFNDLEPVSMKMDDNHSSSSLGPGIELLMNDKKRSSNNVMNVDLGELDDLEKKLELFENDNQNFDDIKQIDTKIFITNINNKNSIDIDIDIDIDNFEVIS